jgi:hypothetical protein
VVVFALRRNLSIRSACLTSLATTGVTHPIVFYLYWWRHWGMVSVELLTIGLELLLLVWVVGVAIKMDSVARSPTGLQHLDASNPLPLPPTAPADTNGRFPIAIDLLPTPSRNDAAPCRS